MGKAHKKKEKRADFVVNHLIDIQYADIIENKVKSREDEAQAS